MKPQTKNLLTDTFGRGHHYLRISLTERCNLRCTYCMPAAGIALSPKENLMSADEIYNIAKIFVAHGINKIRLTGGEPLVRKDFETVFEKICSLPVQVAITTNGILVPRYLPLFKKHPLDTITISIDSLKQEKFDQITRRNYFGKVWEGIELLLAEGFLVKLNIVLIKDFNEDEIVDFVALTKEKNIQVRFIEFMPFDGNRWNKDKLVTQQAILKKLQIAFSEHQIVRLQDAPHDTARHFAIRGYQGSFAIISSVTNPFCDRCNRLRLTADGQLKNCLFAASEVSLLETYRSGESIAPLIKSAVQKKQAARGGMDTFDKLNDPKLHSQNRSMIQIGG